MLIFNQGKEGNQNKSSQKQDVGDSAKKQVENTI